MRYVLMPLGVLAAAVIVVPILVFLGCAFLVNAVFPAAAVPEIDPPWPE